MTGENILLRFQEQIDDATELSSVEELALANEVYIDVSNDREWEWLKTTATGTTSTSVDYLALESDFKQVIPNKDRRSIVFVGTDYQEYLIIPFSARRDFRDQDGFCYIDTPNQRLVFTLQPTEAKAIEYDYIKRPTLLTTSTEPLVTTDQFGNLIAYGMAAKFNPIELSDKSDSYRKENQEEYRKILTDLQLEDANVKLSI